MIIGITGANGFIGSAIARRLIHDGHRVHGLVRSSAVTPEVSPRLGDLTDPKSLEAFVRGLDAVVHCAARTSEGPSDLRLSQAVNVEGTRHLIEACRAAGLRRFIHISSQSARPENPTAYGSTKWRSEELVRHSGLDATILRPSTVYGPGTRGLFAKIVTFIKTLHMIPVIGSGAAQFRPVYVDDVAQAVAAALACPQSVGRTYDVGGADAVTFSAFIRATADQLGTRVLQIHLPIWVCHGIADITRRFMASPPITQDNIVGMAQLEPCDTGPAERDLQYRPLGLSDGLRKSLPS